MAQLQADLRRAAAVHKVHDARKGALLLVVPQPRAAGVMRPSGVGLVISTITSAAPPRRARPGASGGSPAARLDCAVGGHGRDDDAVLERQAERKGA